MLTFHFFQYSLCVKVVFKFDQGSASFFNINMERKNIRWVGSSTPRFFYDAGQIRDCPSASTCGCPPIALRELLCGRADDKALGIMPGGSGNHRSADVLSGRHIVRVTFCHGFLIDVLSGRHFVSTYFVRHFVRKTFCQFSFFVVGFCIDVLSGRQIVSILTIFLVCWHYLWYVYVISGILTIFLVCWHYCPKNGQKWTKMA